MVTKDNATWDFVAKSIDAIMEQHDRLASATDGLMIAPESPLLDPFYRISEQAISALSRMIGDEAGALEWFVWECDFGRDPKLAGTDEELREIDSIDKLRWLIELDAGE